MSEILSNNIDNSEKNTNKEVTEDDINKLQKSSDEIKEINLEERVDETFSYLDGKKFKEGDIIDFDFMNEKNEKIPCSFDIDNQIITYKGENYKIDMPKGANLDSVEFNGGEVILEGSVGWFSGEGKTSYESLYSALNDVFKNGNVKIAAGDGNNVEINKV